MIPFHCNVQLSLQDNSIAAWHNLLHRAPFGVVHLWLIFLNIWIIYIFDIQMSWVQNEWKDGLPHRALQKINEIEGQRDRLAKETQQKQFRLDTLEQVESGDMKNDAEI